VNLHRFDADLDPNPDLTFHFDADPDANPDPYPTHVCTCWEMRTVLLLFKAVTVYIV
jgi:hypothetical protein